MSKSLDKYARELSEALSSVKANKWHASGPTRMPHRNRKAYRRHDKHKGQGLN